MSEQHGPTGKPASSCSSSSGEALQRPPSGEVPDLVEWLTRYSQILAASDKLLHEIRFCSNADELWRMVGMSQEVEDLHTRVLYEADKVEEALQRPPASPPRLFPEMEDEDKSVRTLRWLAQIVGSGRFREMQRSEGDYSVVDPLEPAAKQRIARVLNRAADQLRGAGERPPASLPQQDEQKERT